jgi:hypothetical protein
MYAEEIGLLLKQEWDSFWNSSAPTSIGGGPRRKEMKNSPAK